MAYDILDEERRLREEEDDYEREDFRRRARTTTRSPGDSQEQDRQPLGRDRKPSPKGDPQLVVLEATATSREVFIDSPR
jgi:hypothetical protein